MMALRASGHRAAGERRRAAVSLSHLMSPWRSAAMKLSSRRAASGSWSSRAIPADAKPSARACALTRDSMDRSLVLGPSEIEIGIGGRGRDPPDLIGKQRPEGRARLDALIPGLGVGILLPGHIAEIVDRREMRRGR